MSFTTLLPRPGDEAFKYTSFQRLARGSYQAPGLPTLAADRLPAAEGPRLVFVDGVFAPGLSGLDRLPDGVSVAPGVPQFANPDGNALTQMNAQLADGGLALTIDAGTEVERPLELLFVATGHDERYAVHPRVALRVGANARCTLLERHIALDANRDFVNLVTDARLDRGAALVHMLDQRTAHGAVLSTALHATLEDDARLDGHAVQLGGALVRVDIHVRLAGRGAHCGLYGLHLPAMKQHVDTHTRIDHLVPDTSSDEHYRAVVDKGGRSVFNGKVVVAEGADRSDAQQFNANLLLSDQAEVDTKPELEIYADEVKAAHGATVGKLDEKALFYLRSRGIGESEARSVLVWAFCEEVLCKLPDAATRLTLEDGVLERLPHSDRIRAFR